MRLMQGSPTPVLPLADCTRRCGNAEVSIPTKLEIYRATVFTTVPYASDTWTVYQRNEKKLNRFFLNCFCRLLKVKWQDRVPEHRNPWHGKTYVASSQCFVTYRCNQDKARSMQVPFQERLISFCRSGDVILSTKSNNLLDVYWPHLAGQMTFEDDPLP